MAKRKVETRAMRCGAPHSFTYLLLFAPQNLWLPFFRVADAPRTRDASRPPHLPYTHHTTPHLPVYHWFVTLAP